MGKWATGNERFGEKGKTTGLGKGVWTVMVAVLKVSLLELTPVVLFVAHYSWRLMPARILRDGDLDRSLRYSCKLN